jgi:hypothetical protein
MRILCSVPRNLGANSQTDLPICYDQVLYNIYLLAVCQYLSILFDVTNPKVHTVSVITRKSISVFPKFNSEMNICNYNAIRWSPKDDSITGGYTIFFCLSTYASLFVPYQFTNYDDQHFSQENPNIPCGDVLREEAVSFFIVISLFYPTFHFPELIF